MNQTSPHFLIQSAELTLRDTLPEDVEAYLRWQTHGEWRYLDAPWEGVREEITAKEEKNFRKNFQRMRRQSLEMPRVAATIALPDNTPLGWVSRYKKERFSAVWYIGIDICEDTCLGRGLGSAALKLWVDYLFANSSVHKIGLDTWSFNPRMMHVAEKLGFLREGAERDLIQWQGEWLSLVHFGLLRAEWEINRS